MSLCPFSTADVTAARPFHALTRASPAALPQLDLFTYFQRDLTLLRSWYLPGTHYASTLESWLRLQDAHAKEGMRVLEDDAESKGFGRDEGRKSFYRWGFVLG
jgi:hypothetical protein